MKAFSSSPIRYCEDGVCPRDLSWIANGREIPPCADSVRDDESDLVGGARNVGAPTFKVTLEVRLDVTNCQNGTVPEVIA